MKMKGYGILKLLSAALVRDAGHQETRAYTGTISDALMSSSEELGKRK